MTRRTSSWLLFTLLLVVYSSNIDVLPNYDSFPSVYLGASVLKDGDLSFKASEVPFMFLWRLKHKGTQRSFRIRSWNPTLESLYKKGELTVQTVPYFLMRSKQPGEYASIFGIGSALSALPIFAVFHLFLGDLREHPEALWFAAKLAASLMVAATAVLLFFIALSFVSLPLAWLCALTFGLGTCVWSISSQALWQHAPNELALMLGVFFLLRIPKHTIYAVPTAFAFAWATVCRPTSAIVVICVAIYLLLFHRKALGLYILSGLPFAVGLAYYNHIHFGAPWALGQAQGAIGIALKKTGSPALWQTPLWEGLLGHLISPSRGLLIYSPCLIFVFVAPWLWEKREEFRIFWALIPALVLILGIESMHFDWWGGNSFGYRHIVDLTVIFTLLLIPIIKSIMKHTVLRWSFLLFFLLSIGVQILGAFAYDGWSWNDRFAYMLKVPTEDKPRIVLTKQEAKRLMRHKNARYLKSVILDLDQQAYRYRLWEIRDSQLVYYTTHFWSSYQKRQKILRKWHRTRGNYYPAPWLSVQ